MIEKLPVPEAWNRIDKCQHPEHRPPTFIVLEPGVYRHKCPSCGREHVFGVPPGSSL